MNLCGRPPYQKGQRTKKKPNVATAAQRRRWGVLRSWGCILTHMGIAHHCEGRMTTHHCGTGGGGHKDHDKVVTLCWNMHQGPDGIDRKGGIDGYSKKTWQQTFTTEEKMLEATAELERNGGPSEHW